MKKKCWFLCIVWIAIFLLAFCSNTYATETKAKNDKNRIENLEIIIEPQTKDGSINVQYELTCRVGTSLKKANVKMSNHTFDKVVALSDNIEEVIRDQGQSQVQVVLDKKYEAGEVVTFKFSINQQRVCYVVGDSCWFEFFTPRFDKTRIENLTLKWKVDNVKQSNCQYQEEGYLVWNKKDVEKGKKLVARVKYDKSNFKAIKMRRGRTGYSAKRERKFWVYLIVVIITGIIAFIFHKKLSKW